MRRSETPPAMCSAVPVGRGYCKCGCGQKTVVSGRTHTKYGWKKGEPKRYVFGHQRVRRNNWLVDPETGCWIYQSMKEGQRYATAERGSGTTLVHRQNYEDMVGPIPEGLELDHLCTNKRCVNPAHLEPVTHAENMRRWKEMA